MAPQFWKHAYGYDYYIQRRFALLRYVQGTLICLRFYWRQTTKPPSIYTSEYLTDPRLTKVN